MVCRAGNDRRRRAVRGLGRALAGAAAGRTGRPDRGDLGRDAPARLSPGLRPGPGPGRLGPGSAGRRPGDQRLPSPRAPGEADRPGPVHSDGLAVPGRGRRGAGDPDPSGDLPIPAAVVGDPEVPARRVPLAERRRPGTDRHHGDRPGRQCGDGGQRPEGERQADLQGRSRVRPQPGHLRQRRRPADDRPAARQRHQQRRRRQHRRADRGDRRDPRQLSAAGAGPPGRGPGSPTSCWSTSPPAAG